MKTTHAASGFNEIRMFLLSHIQEPVELTLNVVFSRDPTPPVYCLSLVVTEKGTREPRELSANHRILDEAVLILVGEYRKWKGLSKEIPSGSY